MTGEFSFVSVFLRDSLAGGQGKNAFDNVTDLGGNLLQGLHEATSFLLHCAGPKVPSIQGLVCMLGSSDCFPNHEILL